MLSFWFVFVDLPLFRREEMFQIWHITLQPFIRKSFLSLVEFSRAIRLGINPAVTLCTSLALSMNSGTSRLWRGTDLCLGLGQSTFKYDYSEFTVILILFYFSKILIPCI